MYEIAGYDSFKLACCGNYPDCSNCPYEQEEEEEELYTLFDLENRKDILWNVPFKKIEKWLNANVDDDTDWNDDVDEMNELFEEKGLLLEFIKEDN